MMIHVRQDTDDVVTLLKRSRQVHVNWYRETYPDVAATGMHPAAHYLHYGAAMGRNPGKGFDTGFYLESHPDARASGLNPLEHYVRHGAAKGYAPRPFEQLRAEEKRFLDIRAKLLNFGFTEKPLADLADMARNSGQPQLRARAARELALWHLRNWAPDEARAALDWVAVARAAGPDLAFRRTLVTAELMCHLLLGQVAEAAAVFEAAGMSGETGPDTYLAWSNFQPTPEERCLWINQALEAYGIAPVALLPDPGGNTPVYDRLTVSEPLAPVLSGPKVTVLLAAYESEDKLPTALRALQEQTWKNLEIIVIDDCSPDDGATAAVARRFAADDPRIKVIRMKQNGGAYVARNRGLDAATGEFVTIHDADDWSHPQKIEIQARFLMETPGVMGCTSEQARAQEDLSFTNLRGNGQLIVFNTSSFMYRRAPVRAAIGYWDTVRFGADNEFIRRMQAVFGKRSFRKMPTGPLSFQRISDSSVTADAVTGLAGAYYGVRREYYDAQRHHHRSGRSLKYDGDRNRRVFPVPPMMRPDKRERLAVPRWFDLVLYGDFREEGPEVEAARAEIRAAAAAGRRVGLVEIVEYGRQTREIAMCPDLREMVDGETVEILVYGDEVIARATRVLGEGPLPRLRYVATVLTPEEAEQRAAEAAAAAAEAEAEEG